MSLYLKWVGKAIKVKPGLQKTDSPNISRNIMAVEICMTILFQWFWIKTGYWILLIAIKLKFHFMIKL